MNPRLETSTKWTQLPTEFLDKVKQVFAKNFEAESQVGEFIVEGRVYPSEILIRVGYLEKGRIRQMNFEASCDYSTAGMSAEESVEARDAAMDKIYLCIDAIGGFMEEAFDEYDADEIVSDEDSGFPLSWTAYKFDGQEIFLQYSTINSALEAEADRLLGMNEEQLLHELEASEDALANAVIDSDLAKEIQRKIRAAGGFEPPQPH